MSLTKRIPEVLGLVAALVLAGGCETLNVKNPNAPDSARLLTDPATVQSIAIGAMRTWFSTTQGPTDGADPYPGPRRPSSRDRRTARRCSGSCACRR